MNANLIFDFQKRKQLRFSEVNYLNYTKKTQFCMLTTTISLKQRETRTNSGPIPQPLTDLCRTPSRGVCGCNRVSLCH